MNPKPWLATYRENGIAESVNADAYPSVVHMLDEAMQRYADQPAFRAFGQTLSFADVDRQSAAFAAWLQQRLGVKKGDRIAVMLPNLLAFPIACIGILRAGAVQVNVNPLYTPRELEHQLQDSGSETLVIFNGSTPTLAEVAAQAGIKTVITVAPGDGTGAALPSPPVDARLVGSIAFADALREGASMTRTPVALNGDDLIFLQYTGGTTGLSKGAALSHRNLVANVEQFKATMPSAVRPGQEVIVTAIPLYHIFALMVNFLTYFSAGAESWLVANPRDMDGFVETLKQSKPTVFMGVNTLYAGLVMHPKIREVDFSRLHLAGGGGAAVVGATSAKWKEPSPASSSARATACRKPARCCRSTRHPSRRSPAPPACPCPAPTSSCSTTRAMRSPLGQSGEVCAKGPAGHARLLEPARGQRCRLHTRRLLQDR
jgi:long-chain acyl-CoA synthetase